jgi:insulin-like growth factor-binding protein complex acid labile subunit
MLLVSYRQMNSNRLVKIGRDTLAGLSLLQSLHACCMASLTSVDESAFSHVENLQNLYLFTTGLEEPPLDFSLSFLSNLVNLDLHSSRIGSLAFGAFGGLPSVQSLSLSGNQISSIAAGAFSGLSSLTGLSLDSIQLSSLSAEAFTGLASLQTLNMQNNQLTIILPNTFRDLGSLISL